MENQNQLLENWEEEFEDWWLRNTPTNAAHLKDKVKKFCLIQKAKTREECAGIVDAIRCNCGNQRCKDFDEYYWDQLNKFSTREEAKQKILANNQEKE